VEDGKKALMGDVQKHTSLKDLLEEKKGSFNKKAAAEKKVIYARGIEDVANSGILNNALKVGAEAPSFSLTNATGDKVSI
jgi:hypothetical protein